MCVFTSCLSEEERLSMEVNGEALIAAACSL